MVLFHLFFLCAQPFDQKLEFTLIYFFYLYMTIRPKIKVVTDSFFFICTRPFYQIIWSSFIDSFFCTRPFDLKLGSSLIYFFHIHTTIRQKYMIVFHLFIYLFLFTTIRSNLGSSLINFFICTRPFDLS